MIEVDPIILRYLSSCRNGKFSNRHVSFSHPAHEKTVAAVVEYNRRTNNTERFLDLKTAITMIENGSLPDRVTLLLCTGTVIEHEGKKIVPCIVKNQNGHGPTYHVGFRREDQTVGRGYAVGVFQ
jgi:hypothetical protein